jgi:uncharacterized protein (TIGR03437 family)
MRTIRNRFGKTIWWMIGWAVWIAGAQAQTAPTLTTSLSVATFQYQSGAATLPAAQTVQIVSAPAGVNFTIGVTGSPFNGAWLLVSASSGAAPLPLKIQVNPTGLPAGSYTGAITITPTSGLPPPPSKTITVTLLVSNPPSTLTASPNALNFAYIVGGPIPDPSLTGVFVLASNGSPLSATITVTGATWLKISPTGNISLAGLFNTVSATVNPSGLLPKTYTGTVTIAAPAATNKSQTITITLTVSAVAPKALGTFPTGLIQASPQSIVTLLGSNFYATTTVAATGFTPATTLTVTDAAGTPATATEALGIPVYPNAATLLRVGVASTLPAGTQGAAYAQTLAALGGTAPYSWILISGSLPPGLSIAGSGLFGTPTAAGSYTFTLQIIDSASPFAAAYQVFRMTIFPAGALLAVTVSATPLPVGQLGTAYNQTLTASGGTPPYTWSAVGLPPGITLNAAGVLSGTPTSVGLTGPLTSAPVSDTAILATVPATYLANPGTLRMAVTTPAPGGGVSSDAQLSIFGPAPQIFGVVNSASFAQGTLTPGEIITVFGTGLGPAALTLFNPNTPPIPVSLPSIAPSTSMTIGGVPAPLIYTSATQVSAIVPYTVAGPSAAVVVTYGMQPRSLAFTIAVAPTDPGIYTIASTGQGQGAILNFNAATGDYTVNSTAVAAAKGSTVVLYATGAGAMTSAVSNALIPATPAITPLGAVMVTIGGQAATVNAAQAAPGSVPGVLQINVVVPLTAPTGPAIPVVVNIGGVDSQANVTMAIK